MKPDQVHPDDIVISQELARVKSPKQFDARLRASIDAMGLAEPLKVAQLPSTEPGGPRFVVVDGVLRLQAIKSLREIDSRRFSRIPVHIFEYEKRFEIRFQTDIYQDLLPSQFAGLVEHLYRSEVVKKSDIARSIGVSPATLRNYTGLWRLLQRGGWFATVVELMDAGVLPSSNPFAWMRLNDAGVEAALDLLAGDGFDREVWVTQALSASRAGQVPPVPIKIVESITGGLPPTCYREDAETRAAKQEIGERRRRTADRRSSSAPDTVLRRLRSIERTCSSATLKSVAGSLSSYLSSSHG